MQIRFPLRGIKDDNEALRENKKHNVELPSGRDWYEKTTHQEDGILRYSWAITSETTMSNHRQNITGMIDSGKFLNRVQRGRLWRQFM